MTTDDTAWQATALERIRDDRSRIGRQGRRARSALRVHQSLVEHPVGGIGHLARRTGLSAPTVAAALRLLKKLDIVREITGRQRGHGSLSASATSPTDPMERHGSSLMVQPADRSTSMLGRDPRPGPLGACAVRAAPASYGIPGMSTNRRRVPSSPRHPKRMWSPSTIMMGAERTARTT